MGVGPQMTIPSKSDIPLSEGIMQVSEKYHHLIGSHSPYSSRDKGVSYQENT